MLSLSNDLFIYHAKNIYVEFINDLSPRIVILYRFYVMFINKYPEVKIINIS
jgi:hypothetical protein